MSRTLWTWHLLHGATCVRLLFTSKDGVQNDCTPFTTSLQPTPALPACTETEEGTRTQQGASPSTFQTVLWMNGTLQQEHWPAQVFPRCPETSAKLGFGGREALQGTETSLDTTNQTAQFLLPQSLEQSAHRPAPTPSCPRPRGAHHSEDRESWVPVCLP